MVAEAFVEKRLRKPRVATNAIEEREAGERIVARLPRDTEPDGAFDRRELLLDGVGCGSPGGRARVRHRTVDRPAAPGREARGEENLHRSRGRRRAERPGRCTEPERSPECEERNEAREPWEIRAVREDERQARREHPGDEKEVLHVPEQPPDGDGDAPENEREGRGKVERQAARIRPRRDPTFRQWLPGQHEVEGEPRVVPDQPPRQLETLAPRDRRRLDAAPENATNGIGVLEDREELLAPGLDKQRVAAEVPLHQPDARCDRDERHDRRPRTEATPAEEKDEQSEGEKEDRDDSRGGVLEGGQIEAARTKGSCEKRRALPEDESKGAVQRDPQGEDHSRDGGAVARVVQDAGVERENDGECCGGEEAEKPLREKESDRDTQQGSGDGRDAERPHRNPGRMEQREGRHAIKKRVLARAQESLVPEEAPSGGGARRDVAVQFVLEARDDGPFPGHEDPGVRGQGREQIRPEDGEGDDENDPACSSAARPERLDLLLSRCDLPCQRHEGDSREDAGRDRRRARQLEEEERPGARGQERRRPEPGRDGPGPTHEAGEGGDDGRGEIHGQNEAFAGKRREDTLRQVRSRRGMLTDSRTVGGVGSPRPRSREPASVSGSSR
ncbi:MAG: hypothetical protein WCC53_05490 [Thermoanaerobaculia bacterium]